MTEDEITEWTEFFNKLCGTELKNGKSRYSINNQFIKKIFVNRGYFETTF